MPLLITVWLYDFLFFYDISIIVHSSKFTCRIYLTLLSSCYGYIFSKLKISLNTQDKKSFSDIHKNGQQKIYGIQEMRNHFFKVIFLVQLST